MHDQNDQKMDVQKKNKKGEKKWKKGIKTKGQR